MPIVHRPSSIVHRPSSIVHRPSSIVHRPSSIVHRKQCPYKLVFFLLYVLCFRCKIRSRLRLSGRPNIAFGYADDVALVAPTLYALDKIIKVCEIFADTIGLLFNPLKSQLLCYNVDNTVYVTLGNTTVRTSLHEKHLGRQFY